jgi:serine protease Do
MTLQVTAREQPANYGVSTANEQSSSQEEAAPQKSFNNLGLEVSPLTAEVAKQLSLDSRDGVVITGVKEDSPAAHAGLHESLVIVQVGRKPVRTVDEFQAAVKDTPLDQGVLLLVRSSEGSRFVVVKSE